MMTPEEAAQRRDCLIDLGFLVETPALRAYKTIANLEWEYAVQVRWDSGDKHRQITTWHQVTEWSTDPNPFRPGKRLGREERIIRRLVSGPEVVPDV